MRVTLTLSLALTLVVLAGCGTYINIPRQPADVAWHDPNDFTVKRVQAAALTYLINRMPATENYGLVLTEGASDNTYAFVMDRVPGNPHYQRAGEIQLPTFSVAGVFVRGSDAQVDIVRPTTDGSSQLVSVYLEFGIDGWYGRRHRVWNIPVAEALKVSYPGANIE